MGCVPRTKLKAKCYELSCGRGGANAVNHSAKIMLRRKKRRRRIDMLCPQSLQHRSTMIEDISYHIHSDCFSGVVWTAVWITVSVNFLEARKYNFW
jgi:hypothetical protein